VANRRDGLYDCSAIELRTILREELHTVLEKAPNAPLVLRTAKSILIELIEIAGLLTILGIVAVLGWSKILAALH
jgi:hypothetical protein